MNDNVTPDLKEYLDMGSNKRFKPLDRSRSNSREKSGSRKSATKAPRILAYADSALNVGGPPSPAKKKKDRYSKCEMPSSPGNGKTASLSPKMAKKRIVRRSQQYQSRRICLKAAKNVTNGDESQERPPAPVVVAASMQVPGS